MKKYKILVVIMFCIVFSCSEERYPGDVNILDMNEISVTWKISDSVDSHIFSISIQSLNLEKFSRDIRLFLFMTKDPTTVFDLSEIKINKFNGGFEQIYATEIDSNGSLAIDLEQHCWPEEIKLLPNTPQYNIDVMFPKKGNYSFTLNSIECDIKLNYANNDLDSGCGGTTYKYEGSSYLVNQTVEHFD